MLDINNSIDKSDFLTIASKPQYDIATVRAFDLRLINGNYDKSEFISQIGLNKIQTEYQEGFFPIPTFRYTF